MPLSTSDYLTLAMIGSGALSGYLGQKSSNKDRQQAAALAAQQMANQKDIATQNTAADEAALDPFRQQMAQAGDLSKLDQLERASYSPVTMDFSGAGKYAKYVPQMSGGFSYTKSPELIDSAAALKRNVMGGNAAPTMTNPANYGRTSALNLLGIKAAGVDPGTVNAGAPPGTAVSTSGAPGVSSADPSMKVAPGVNAADPMASYLTGEEQRGGGTGGVMAGAGKGAMMGLQYGKYTGAGIVPAMAGGAVVGGIYGAITKHAKSAPSDYPVNEAKSVLDRAIRQQLGRPPNPGEIDDMLAGQGLKPGDRYVGQAGLLALLDSLGQQQSSMQPSYYAHG